MAVGHSQSKRTDEGGLRCQVQSFMCEWRRRILCACVSYDIKFRSLFVMHCITVCVSIYCISNPQDSVTQGKLVGLLHAYIKNLIHMYSPDTVACNSVVEILEKLSWSLFVMFAPFCLEIVRNFHI